MKSIYNFDNLEKYFTINPRTGKVDFFKCIDRSGEKKKVFLGHFDETGNPVSSLKDNQILWPYGMETIKNKKNIFIVEGEKCAFALYQFLIRANLSDTFGVVGMHGTGGMQDPPRDFFEFLDNKKVFIIPDLDDSFVGQNAANKLIIKLKFAGFTPDLILLDGKNKPGFDIFDWLQIQDGEPTEIIEKLFQLIHRETGLVEPTTTENLRAALDYIDSDNYDNWIRVGLALKTQDEKQLFLDYSSKSNKFDRIKAEKKWDSFRPSSIGIGTIFHIARQNGWKDENLILPEKVKKKIDKSFPYHVIENENGIIKQVYDFITEQQPTHPQKILNFVAAIAYCSAIFGRKYITETGNGTNIYVIGLGQSGCGKNAAFSALQELSQLSKIAQVTSVRNLASDAAIITELEETPSQVFLLDELGKFLQSIKNQNATHKIEISRLLLELYSSANTIYSGKSYADKKNKKILNYPNLSIYGASTPENFYAAIDKDLIDNGFVSRLLVFDSDNHFPEPESVFYEKRNNEKYLDLFKLLKKIYLLNNDNERGIFANNERTEFRPPVLTVVKYSDEAKQIMNEYNKLINSQKKTAYNNDEIFSPYNRAVQSAMKFSLIFAVSKNYENPIIEKNDAQNAVDIINYAVNKMIFDIPVLSANNEREIQIKEFMKFIRSKSSVSRRELTRKFRKYRAYDRDEILMDLQESGEIELRTDGKKTIITIAE